MSMSITAESIRSAGFPMGGEPLVALDLADTVLLRADPPVDLIADPERGRTWWALQAPRLPAGPLPDPAATGRLRAAIREVLDARIERRPAEPTALADLNAIAASVPTSPRVGGSGEELRTGIRWHVEHGGNPALAAIAGETIGLLGSPDRLDQLRRCASPQCSMVFLADNSRRKWCSSGVCGNRARVARHQERVRAGAAGPASEQKPTPTPTTTKPASKRGKR